MARSNSKVVLPKWLPGDFRAPLGGDAPTRAAYFRHRAAARSPGSLHVSARTCLSVACSIHRRACERHGA